MGRDRICRLAAERGAPTGGCPVVRSVSGRNAIDPDAFLSGSYEPGTRITRLRDDRLGGFPDDPKTAGNSISV